jgi:hypothetical protein
MQQGPGSNRAGDDDQQAAAGAGAAGATLPNTEDAAPPSPAGDDLAANSWLTNDQSAAASSQVQQDAYNPQLVGGAEVEVEKMAPLEGGEDILDATDSTVTEDVTTPVAQGTATTATQTAATLNTPEALRIDWNTQNQARLDEYETKRQELIDTYNAWAEGKNYQGMEGFADFNAAYPGMADALDQFGDSIAEDRTAYITTGMQQSGATTYDPTTLSDEDIAKADVVLAQGTVTKDVTATDGTITHDATAATADVNELAENELFTVVHEDGTITERAVGEVLSAEEIAALTPEEVEQYEAAKHDPTKTFRGVSIHGTASQVDLESVREQMGYTPAIATAASGDATQINVDDAISTVASAAGPGVTTTAATGTSAHVNASEAVDSMGFGAAAVEYAEAGEFEDFLAELPPDMVAAQMTAVTGEAARGIAAQVDIDSALARLEDQPDQMQAVVAALPTEALVTSQLDNLLKELDGGNVPTWARPALAAVEGQLAQRGLGKSSVARDSLFNAIIQSAMPLAQSNATALQERANLNLGYQNQAEQFNAQMQQQLNMQVNDKVALFVGQNADLRQQMELANLDAATKLELANLEYMNAANKENMTEENNARLQNLRAFVETESTNAQVGTAFGTLEITNEQASLVLGAQFKQEVGLAESAAMGNFLTLNATWLQETLSQNLGNEQTIAEITAKYEAETGLTLSSTAKDFLLSNAGMLHDVGMQTTDNQQQVNILNSTFAQESGMAESDAVKNFIVQNAELVQGMELANISYENQAEFINLEMEYKIDKDNMDADNLAKLEKYRADVEIGLAKSSVMTALNVQNLTNKQDAAITNAMNSFNMDVVNLTEEGKKALANSAFFQTVEVTNLSNQQQAAMLQATNWAAMDLANKSAKDTAMIENARNWLQMDLANLDVEAQKNMFESQTQFQSMLANMDASNVAAQFNATSDNQVKMFMKEMVTQIEQFNVGQLNAMESFNVNERNAVELHDSQMDFARQSFNANMFNLIQQSNVNYYRGINEFNTTAANQVNQINAANIYNMSRDGISMLVQELRDSANYSFLGTEGSANREVQLVIAGMEGENMSKANRAELFGNFLTWATNLFDSDGD